MGRDHDASPRRGGEYGVYLLHLCAVMVGLQVSPPGGAAHRARRPRMCRRSPRRGRWPTCVSSVPPIADLYLPQVRRSELAAIFRHLDIEGGGRLHTRDVIAALSEGADVEAEAGAAVAVAALREAVVRWGPGVMVGEFEEAMEAVLPLGDSEALRWLQACTTPSAPLALRRCPPINPTPFTPLALREPLPAGRHEHRQPRAWARGGRRSRRCCPRDRALQHPARVREKGQIRPPRCCSARGCGCCSVRWTAPRPACSTPRCSTSVHCCDIRVMPVQAWCVPKGEVVALHGGDIEGLLRGLHDACCGEGVVTLQQWERFCYSVAAQYGDNVLQVFPAAPHHASEMPPPSVHTLAYTPVQAFLHHLEARMLARWHQDRSRSGPCAPSRAWSTEGAREMAEAAARHVRATTASPSPLSPVPGHRTTATSGSFPQFDGSSLYLAQHAAELSRAPDPLAVGSPLKSMRGRAVPSDSSQVPAAVCGCVTVWLHGCMCGCWAGAGTRKVQGKLHSVVHPC